jgi:hypothetical protein
MHESLARAYASTLATEGQQQKAATSRTSAKERVCHTAEQTPQQSDGGGQLLISLPAAGQGATSSRLQPAHAHLYRTCTPLRADCVPASVYHRHLANELRVGNVRRVEAERIST